MDNHNTDNGNGKTRRRTPCTILTGFLGSGKTTLLNHILNNNENYKTNSPNNNNDEKKKKKNSNDDNYQQKAEEEEEDRRRKPRIAVIENEFGEVGIDDALVVIETEEEIFEMNNGCVCCTVRGDLLRILDKLSKRYRPQNDNNDNKPRRRPYFDHIIIETTGLADPAPVAQTFFVDDSAIKDHYELDAIVTVVDAAHIVPHLVEVKPEGIENESVEQLAFADKILLNKVDLVTQEEKDNVVEHIRAINEYSEIIECSYGKVDVESILNIKAFDLAKVLQKEESFLDDINNTEQQQHQHDSTISSVGIQFEGSLHAGKLNTWLTVLLRDNGVDIFRSKGVLNIHGSDARHVFQGVHMLMTISSSNDGGGGDGSIRPWKEGEPRTNRLIFIGRNLDRKTIESKFKECVVRAS